MSTHQPQPSETGAPSKMRIPRLERHNDPPATSPRGKGRTQRACLSCRARKIKCDGAQPRCSNCEENTADCAYVSGRKDRLKTATKHNQSMIRLLNSLKENAPSADKERIEEMLRAVAEDVADAAISVGSSLSPDKAKTSEPDEERGEANVSAEVGSSHELETMDEDLLRSETSRATGFLGKSSEIQWMRGLHRTADHAVTGDVEEPYGPPGGSTEAAGQRVDAMRRRQHKRFGPSRLTSDYSFFLDNENVGLDFDVEPQEMPRFETAERLLETYVTTVQNSFPILAKRNFVDQFYQYYASMSRGNCQELNQESQAVMNMVFAIAAAYSHLTELSWRADERDHLIYHARACRLGGLLTDPCWFSQPRLLQVQLTGLLALYYLAIGHVNRAWVVGGISLRFAYALGLHVRNEDRTATSVKKELTSRIWWGLYFLEGHLSTLVGRPSAGVFYHCSVPAPLPVSAQEIEEAILEARFGDRYQDFTSGSTSTNSGSYLKHAVKIGMITAKAMDDLYSSGTSEQSWENVQSKIAGLTHELERWVAALPAGLNFFRSNTVAGYQQERTTLQIYYFSARILISRPCLCRLEYRIKNQTQVSDNFNKTTAQDCVSAAKAFAALLPDDIQRVGIGIYSLSPWWSIVHYIKQSVTILLLEICYDAKDFPLDREHAIPSLKKLLRWLRFLKSNNLSARRAYDIAFGLLQKLVVNIDVDISDLLNEDPNFSSSITPPGSEGSNPTTHTQQNPSQTSAFSHSEPYPAPDTSMHSFREDQGDPNFLGSMDPGGSNIFQSFDGDSPPGQYAQYFTHPYIYVTPYDEQSSVLADFTMDFTME